MSAGVEWVLRRVCCGRDDGTERHPDWEAVNAARDAYEADASDGHARLGIIELHRAEASA